MSELSTRDGHTVAYVHHPGTSPGVLFCAGFNSNMQGDKALFLEQWCLAQGRQFTRFDYFGHGESSGDFSEGTIGRWLDDALRVLDEVTEGKQIVVGSSMGGWIALLLSRQRPDRIAALVGLAAAPDFTRRLATQGLSPAQQAAVRDQGYCEIDNCYDDGEPYRITRQLLEEGEAHCLLDSVIPYKGPVLLIQGQQDPDVPWETALNVAQLLESEQVEVTLIKDAEHRLSRPQDLEVLAAGLQRLLQ